MKMNTIVEYKSEDKIFFEFNKLEYIDDFDLLKDIIVTELESEIAEELEGPSSRVCIFKKDNFLFKLFYDSDFGNTITLIEQNDKNNDLLRVIVKDIYNFYVKKYPQNINDFDDENIYKFKDRQDFHERFRNNEFGIYIVVRKEYKNEMLDSMLMLRKLAGDKIGVIAWLKKEDALSFLNDFDKGKGDWKVVKIFGRNFQHFIDKHSSEYKDRFVLNIDLE